MVTIDVPQEIFMLIDYYINEVISRSQMNKIIPSDSARDSFTHRNMRYLITSLI